MKMYFFVCVIFIWLFSLVDLFIIKFIFSLKLSSLEGLKIGCFVLLGICCFIGWCIGVFEMIIEEVCLW